MSHQTRLTKRVRNAGMAVKMQNAWCMARCKRRFRGRYAQPSAALNKFFVDEIIDEILATNLIVDELVQDMLTVIELQEASIQVAISTVDAHIQAITDALADNDMGQLVLSPAPSIPLSVESPAVIDIDLTMDEAEWQSFLQDMN